MNRFSLSTLSAIAFLAVTPGLAFDDLPFEELAVEAELPRATGMGRGMAFGFGSLWATGGQSLMRIHAHDNTVSEIASVGGGRFRGIAVGEGAIWVPEVDRDTILKIDPVSGAIVGEIPAQMLGAQGKIGVGEGGVWVVTQQDFDKTLTRFHHATGEVEAEITLPSSGMSVAVAHGTVWVTAPVKSELYRIDPTTNSVISTTKLGRSPQDLVADGEAVWVYNAGDGTVQRVEGASGESVATIDIGSTGTGEIDAGGGYIWLSLALQSLIQIDPETNSVLRRYMAPRRAGYMRYGAGSVWLGLRSIVRVAIPD